MPPRFMSLRFMPPRLNIPGQSSTLLPRISFFFRAVFFRVVYFPRRFRAASAPLLIIIAIIIIVIIASLVSFITPLNRSTALPLHRSTALPPRTNLVSAFIQVPIYYAPRFRFQLPFPRFPLPCFRLPRASPSFVRRRRRRSAFSFSSLSLLFLSLSLSDDPIIPGNL